MVDLWARTTCWAKPADNMTEPDELLTVKEYAAMFKLSPRGVHKAIKAGRLPYPIERPLGRMAFIRVPASLVAKLKAA